MAAYFVHNTHITRDITGSDGSTHSQKLKSSESVLKSDITRLCDGPDSHV